MRFPVLAVLTALPFSSLHASDALPEPLPVLNLKEGKLRVLTYNVFGGRNPDNAKDVSRIIQVMKLINADVIALQEIDIKTKRFDSRDLLKELEEAMNMQGHFMETIPLQGGHYGLATLSRVKVLQRGGRELPRHKDREVRCIMDLHLELPNGKKLTFLNTHLDHTAEESNRLAQAKDIAANSPKTPALLLGDMNARSTSKTHEILNQNWKDTWNLISHPKTSRESRIDFIFTNDTSLKVTHVADGESIFPDNKAWKALIDSASDHPPVIAEVEVK